MSASRAGDADRALEHSPVFGLFSVETRRRLAAGGAIVSLEPGAMLCQQGDLADAAWLIIQGEIEIRTVAPDGRQVRIAALAAGAVAGEMSVLDGAPRSADMIAIRRSQLLRLSRAAFVAAVEAEPTAALALIRSLTARLRATDRSLEAAQVQDLGSRLADLLLGEAGQGSLVAMTQTEMARRLGASREKVNRKLHAWRVSGLLDVSRAGVRLTDKQRLAAASRRQAG